MRFFHAKNSKKRCLGLLCFKTVQKDANLGNLRAGLPKKFVAWRALACGGLALLICGTALLGTAGATAGSVNQNVQGGSAAALGNAANSSGLIFDDAAAPAFVTKSGVEIRYANGVAGQTNGCYYFNMGSYAGSSLRWLIVGMGSGAYEVGNGSPAFERVKQDGAKQLLANTLPQPNVPAGELVCVLDRELDLGAIIATWQWQGNDEWHYSLWSLAYHQVTIPPYPASTDFGLNMNIVGSVRMQITPEDAACIASTGMTWVGMAECCASSEFVRTNNGDYLNTHTDWFIEKKQYNSSATLQTIRHVYTSHDYYHHPYRGAVTSNIVNNGTSPYEVCRLKIRPVITLKLYENW